MPTTMTIPRHLGGTKYTTEVATEAELLEFANTVREAGGAGVLDALLPSEPSNPSSCLIANALNFSCSVRGYIPADPKKHGCDENGRRPDGSDTWGMYLPENMTVERVKAIAEATGCAYDVQYHRCVLILPPHIGNAAAAFDAEVAFTDLNTEIEL